MFRLIVASVLVTCALAAPKKINWFPNGRIVGGTEAEPAEFPWQISLQVLGSHICGGSIISENYIATAGHCSDYPALFYSVVVGTNSLASGGSSHSVAKISRHPDYATLDTGIPINDIALFRLSSPLTFSDTVQAAELPTAGQELEAGTLVTISGWGATEEGGGLPSDLMKVEVPIVSKEDCNTAYSPYGGLPEGQICAGLDEGGKDSCQGDSGGPLTLGNVLVGIVSWGNGCAEPGYPGVYTEVAAFLDFIQSVIAAH